MEDTLNKGYIHRNAPYDVDRSLLLGNIWLLYIPNAHSILEFHKLYLAFNTAIF
jgi:hypothetical protein